MTYVDPTLAQHTKILLWKYYCNLRQPKVRPTLVQNNKILAVKSMGTLR